MDYLAYHIEARAQGTGSARPCVNSFELSVSSLLRLRAPFCWLSALQNSPVSPHRPELQILSTNNNDNRSHGKNRSR